MDLPLTTLKVISFYLLHNVSTLNQCRKLSCGTVVCKQFASYKAYPNYRWDLIRWAKGYIKGRTICLRNSLGVGSLYLVRQTAGRPSAAARKNMRQRDKCCGTATGVAGSTYFKFFQRKKKVTTECAARSAKGGDPIRL
jgi:hypothetical protein